MRHQLGLTLAVLLLYAIETVAQQKTPLPDGAAVRLGVHRLRVQGTIQGSTFSTDGHVMFIAFSAQEKIHVASFDVKTGFERRRLTIPKAYDVKFANARPLVMVPTSKGFEAWDIEKEKRVWQWPHPDPNLRFGGYAISPDGKWAAAMGWEKDDKSCIYRWDLTTGAAPTIIRPGHDRGESIQFSADGSKFFTASSTVNYSDGKKQWVVAGAVIAWNTTTGKQLGDRRFQNGPLVVAPDGSRIAEADQNAVTISRLEFGTEARPGALMETSIPVRGYQFAFSPDGKQMLIQAQDQSLRLCDLASSKEVRTLEGLAYGHNHQPHFSADGKLVAVVQEGYANAGSVQIWEVASGKQLRFPTGHPGTVNGLAYSPDGKRLATCSNDVLLVYESATGAELLRWVAHKSSIEQIAFSPDGKTLASGSIDGTIALWDPATGKERKRLDARDSVRSIAFTRDGARLTCVCSNRSVQTWDLAKGAVIHNTTAAEEMMSPILSPTGQYAISFGGGARRDRSFELGTPVHWLSVRTGKMLLPMHVRPAPVADMEGFGFDGTIIWDTAFSPDGKLLATCDSLQTQSIRTILSDHTVRVWESASRREIMRFTRLPMATHLLAISPDNRMLAHGISGYGGGFGWGSASSALILRDISAAQNASFADENQADGAKPKSDMRDKLKEFRQISGHLGSITCLTFSPDGKFLATGGSDAVVYTWPVKDFFKRPEAPAANGDVSTLWPILADTDAGKAYRAIALLERNPKDAIALLRKNLQATPRSDEKAIAQHLRDVSSGNFTVRQRAYEALEKSGEQAAHQVRAALMGSPNLEVKRRMELLLEKLDDPLADVNQLRRYRCLVLLERLATPEARKFLEELTQGAPAAWLTIEARHSLERVAK